MLFAPVLWSAKGIRVLPTPNIDPGPPEYSIKIPFCGEFKVTLFKKFPTFWKKFGFVGEVGEDGFSSGDGGGEIKLLFIERSYNLFFDGSNSFRFSFTTVSYLLRPKVRSSLNKLEILVFVIPDIGEEGSIPNKFKCVPVNPTPACAKVEDGRYTP